MCLEPTFYINSRLLNTYTHFEASVDWIFQRGQTGLVQWLVQNDPGSIQ